MKTMTVKEAREFLAEFGRQTAHGDVPMDTTLKLYMAAAALDRALEEAERPVSRRIKFFPAESARYKAKIVNVLEDHRRRYIIVLFEILESSSATIAVGEIIDHMEPVSVDARHFPLYRAVLEAHKARIGQVVDLEMQVAKTHIDDKLVGLFGEVEEHHDQEETQKIPPR